MKVVRSRRWTHDEVQIQESIVKEENEEELEEDCFLLFSLRGPYSYRIRFFFFHIT